MAGLDIAASSAGTGLQWGVLGAVFLAGLRHGVDLDHLAAISDISSSQTNKRRSLLLSTMYAGGHALVLLVLGGVAVLAGERIPGAIDSFMGRLIGLTLVALGAYVVYSLLRYGRDARLRSRWMIVLASVRRTLHWLRPAPDSFVKVEHAHPHSHDADTHLHTHPDEHLPPSVPALRVDGSPSGRVAVVAEHSHVHAHTVPAPRDPFADYSVATAFGVGTIHGVGAETPTQVLLFATTAGVAGSASGIVVLLSFVAGLLVANTAVAIAAVLGFSTGRRLPVAYFILAGVASIGSVYVGTLYLIGRPDLLPAFLGG